VSTYIITWRVAVEVAMVMQVQDITDHLKTVSKFFNLHKILTFE
jgi:hypothetical protein